MDARLIDAEAHHLVPAGLADQQEIMGALADCIMEVYALESCLLRAEKLLAAKGAAAAKQPVAITRYYAVKSLQTVESAARKVIGAVAEGDMLRTQVAILRRLGKYEPADTVALGRQIASHVLAAGRYQKNEDRLARDELSRHANCLSQGYRLIRLQRRRASSSPVTRPGPDSHRWAGRRAR